MVSYFINSNNTSMFLLKKNELLGHCTKNQVDMKCTVQPTCHATSTTLGVPAYKLKVLDFLYYNY